MKTACAASVLLGTNHVKRRVPARYFRRQQVGSRLIGSIVDHNKVLRGKCLRSIAARQRLSSAGRFRVTTIAATVTTMDVPDLAATPKLLGWLPGLTRRTRIYARTNHGAAYLVKLGRGSWLAPCAATVHPLFEGAAFLATTTICPINRCSRRPAVSVLTSFARGPNSESGSMEAISKPQAWNISA